MFLEVVTVSNILHRIHYSGCLTYLAVFPIQCHLELKRYLHDFKTNCFPFELKMTYLSYYSSSDNI